MSWFGKSKPDVAEALKQLPRLVVDLAIADWNAYVTNSRLPQPVQPPPIGAIPDDRQDLHALFGECLALHHFFLQLALMQRPALHYRQQFLPALTHSYGPLATAIPFIWRSCQLMALFVNTRGYEGVAKSHLNQVFSLIPPEHRTQQLIKKFQEICNNGFNIIRRDRTYQRAINSFNWNGADKILPSMESWNKPQQPAPPPRQEPPPRRESAPPTSTTDQVRVTSLRQAYEILGMPAGSTTLVAARTAYRARIAEYHPDKTMNLGRELQELAARKTLEFNLAMEFIEKNCSRSAEVSGRSATRSSEPPADGNSTGHSDGNGSIYPEDSIVSAAEDDPRGLFLRGPFDDLDEDAFCDPYVLGLDYTDEFGRTYISINSWKGRIRCDTDKDCLLGSDILELASRGGWDRDNDYSWEQVSCGGADVIPHYVTKRMAAGLRDFLRTAPNEIEFEGRTILRDTLLRAAEILEAGPTTMPW